MVSWHLTLVFIDYVTCDLNVKAFISLEQTEYHLINKYVTLKLYKGFPVAYCSLKANEKRLRYAFFDRHVTAQCGLLQLLASLSFKGDWGIISWICGQWHYLKSISWIK